MTVQSLVPWLLLAMVVSISGMVFAASGSDGGTHFLAASGFALVMIAAAVAVNVPYWRGQLVAATPSPVVVAARRNARLQGLSYAWGGAAMAADYSLSPLDWRHDWQYALGMTIASLICFAYARRVVQPGATLATPRMLHYAEIAGLLQGAGALIGVLHLFASGKIWTFGADWAANHIFLVGGALLACLSLFGVLSHRRAARLALGNKDPGQS